MRAALLVVVALALVATALPAAEARGPGGGCRLAYREHTIADSTGTLPDLVVPEPYLECYY